MELQLTVGYAGAYAWKRSSKTCMKLTSAECTVENSWWWVEKMPETCRDLWQNKIGIVSASVWLFKKKSITMHGNMNVKRRSFPIFNVHLILKQESKQDGLEERHIRISWREEIWGAYKTLIRILEGCKPFGKASVEKSKMLFFFLKKGC
jgi:hypothetical protein